MAFERQYCVIATHSLTVVHDTHKPSATEFDIYVYSRCSGIDRIFDQFFNDGCGTLYHLTGSRSRAFLRPFCRTSICRSVP